MSAQGREWVEQQEHDADAAPRILGRVRGWLRRKGIRVQGDMYIHALEDLVRPEPEVPLDAGWPHINEQTGTVNR